MAYVFLIFVAYLFPMMEINTWNRVLKKHIWKVQFHTFIKNVRFFKEFNFCKVYYTFSFDFRFASKHSESGHWMKKLFQKACHVYGRIEFDKG